MIIVHAFWSSTYGLIGWTIGSRAYVVRFDQSSWYSAFAALAKHKAMLTSDMLDLANHLVWQIVRINQWGKHPDQQKES